MDYKIGVLIDIYEGIAKISNIISNAKLDYAIKKNLTKIERVYNIERKKVQKHPSFADYPRIDLYKSEVAILQRKYYVFDTEEIHAKDGTIMKVPKLRLDADQNPAFSSEEAKKEFFESLKDLENNYKDALDRINQRQRLIDSIKDTTVSIEWYKILSAETIKGLTDDQIQFFSFMFDDNLLPKAIVEDVTRDTI